MKITNNLKPICKTTEPLECGQLWYDWTCKCTYLLMDIGTPGDKTFLLVDVHTGRPYACPSVIDEVFSKDRQDFIRIEAEMILIKEV